MDEPASAPVPSLHPFEHEPAPAEPRRLIPDRGNFMRGLVLSVVTAGLTAADVFAVRKLGWFSVPLVPTLGIPALISAWAAVIHITGGEKFDDHRWI